MSYKPLKPKPALTPTPQPDKLPYITEYEDAQTGTTDFPTVESRADTGNTREAARGVTELAGYIPGLNVPAQAALTADDLSQGNYRGAAINAAFALPLVKPIAKGAKILSKVGKYAKNFLNKGGAKAITNTGGAKAITNTAKPYTPKELPHYGDMRDPRNLKFINPEKTGKIFDITTSRGKIYDEKISDNFNWEPSMFRKMPTIGGRKMVDVNPGQGIPPQRFYKSLGAGKKFFADGTSSQGHWIPLEGYGKSPNTDKWFIKKSGRKENVRGGWDEGYGSKAFFNMGKQIKAFGYD